MWAIPCNGIIECEDGRDEDTKFKHRTCHISHGYLLLSMSIGICMITLFIFIFLKISNMNDLKSVEDISNEKIYDIIDKRINQGNDMKGCPSEGDKLTLALRLQHDKKHESRRIFKDEVSFHKHEQIAICCMKVCFQ